MDFHVPGHTFLNKKNSFGFLGYILRSSLVLVIIGLIYIPGYPYFLDVYFLFFGFLRATLYIGHHLLLDVSIDFSIRIP